MTTHIEELKDTIRHLHGAEPTHVGTVSVVESFQGQTVWQGEVEVFDLHGHPKTNRAYAWAHEIDDSNRPRYVTVLHVPPVTSPELAVRAAIAHEYHEQQKK